MSETQLLRSPHRLVDYRKIAAAAILVSVGVLAGFIRQNDLVQVYVTATPLIALLLLSLLTLAVMALLKWRASRKTNEGVLWSIVLIGSSIAALSSFMTISYSIDRWEVRAVRDYVARALPVLDQIKARDGAYPDSLPEAVLGKPPVLIRPSVTDQRMGYQIRGASFRFWYVDPAQFNDGWELTGNNRQWDLINE